MKKGTLIIIAVIVIIIGMAFGSYNGLVTMNENVTTKWSQVENQLQRRYDVRLFEAADAALYQAKQAGRDGYRIAPPWPN